MIGDYFTDYQNDLDDQLIRIERNLLELEDIKVYSFYSYLKKRDAAAASFYYRNDYDLRSEIYTYLRKSKRRKVKNDKMDSRE